jgi:hypothetical protein
MGTIERSTHGDTAAPHKAMIESSSKKNPPLLRTTSGRQLYIKAIFLGVAAIAVWRGVWVLLDLYLFPSNLTASCVISIAFGMLLFILYGEIRM